MDSNYNTDYNILFLSEEELNYISDLIFSDILTECSLIKAKENSDEHMDFVIKKMQSFLNLIRKIKELQDKIAKSKGDRNNVE